MSLYLGKKAGTNSALLHITKNTQSLSTMQGPPITDSVFHSDLKGYSYKIYTATRFRNVKAHEFEGYTPGFNYYYEDFHGVLSGYYGEIPLWEAYFFNLSEDGNSKISQYKYTGEIFFLDSNYKVIPGLSIVNLLFAEDHPHLPYGYEIPRKNYSSKYCYPCITVPQFETYTLAERVRYVLIAIPDAIDFSGTTIQVTNTDILLGNTPLSSMKTIVPFSNGAGIEVSPNMHLVDNSLLSGAIKLSADQTESYIAKGSVKIISSKHKPFHRSLATVIRPQSNLSIYITSGGYNTLLATMPSGVKWAKVTIFAYGTSWPTYIDIDAPYGSRGLLLDISYNAAGSMHFLHLVSINGNLYIHARSGGLYTNYYLTYSIKVETY